MIDFSKIRFGDRPNDFPPNTVSVWAGLQINVEKTVDRRFSDEQMAEIKNQMRQELHHNVYGELYRPIMELIEVALRSRDPEAWDRAEQLRDEILGLLKRP